MNEKIRNQFDNKVTYTVNLALSRQIKDDIRGLSMNRISMKDWHSIYDNVKSPVVRTLALDVIHAVLLEINEPK